MHALDNPDEYRFVRHGKNLLLPESERLAAWDRALMGPAKADMFGARMPSKAVLKRAAEMLAVRAKVLARTMKG